MPKSEETNQQPKTRRSLPRPFGVLVLSGASPRSVALLVSRLGREVAGATVCGVVYASRPGESSFGVAAYFFRHLGEWAFVRHTLEGVLGNLGAVARGLGCFLLRLVHASPADLNPQTQFHVEHLAGFCGSSGTALLQTTDVNSPEVIEFARRSQPDLGVVQEAQDLVPEILKVPRHGWIAVEKGNRRRGGPVALWELLEGKDGMELTVCRKRAGSAVCAAIVTTGRAATLAIQPYDTLTSLALKAEVVGNDLLVSSTSDVVQGTVNEKPREAEVVASRGLEPYQVAEYVRQIAARRPPYRIPRRWPVWKLLLRTLVFAAVVTVRNWMRRLRRRFPVVILSHHLVSDRPHRLGMPTELFLRRVQFIQRYYRVVSLTEAIELLAADKVKVPTAVLTFDDGYRENFLTLRAVAAATGVPFTLFVCTENISMGREFRHDTVKGEYGFPPLTWEQIAYLSQDGFEIGSHTRSHFDCGSTEVEALRSEIAGSKTELEQHLGQVVRFFAFPWGLRPNISPASLALARETYPHVFSSYGGVNFPASAAELWHLKRCGHPKSAWALALTMESALDVPFPFSEGNQS